MAINLAIPGHVSANNGLWAGTLNGADVANLDGQGLNIGSDRLLEVSRMYGEPAMFFTNTAMKFHVTSVPGIIPADNVLDLTANTAANRFDNGPILAEWWESYIVPTFINNGINVCLDFSGVMIGLRGGVRFNVPRGRGGISFVGGGTGGVFFNKFAPLDSGEYQQFRVAPSDILAGVVPGATHCDRLWIDGMRFIDPAPDVHAGVLEQSHGPNTSAFKNVWFTNNLIDGMGDEGWETGLCDTLWVNGNLFRNCVAVTAEGTLHGAISVKDGDRNYTCGTNFFRDMPPVEGTLRSAINVKLVNAGASNECHNINLGRIICQDVNIGLGLSTTTNSAYGVTVDEIIMGGACYEGIHKEGGLNPIGLYGLIVGKLRIDDQCVRALNINSTLADARFGSVYAKKCTSTSSAIFLGEVTGMRIDYLQVDECPTTVVSYSSSARDVVINAGKIGWSLLGCGKDATGTTALFSSSSSTHGHILGDGVTIYATEHRGSRIIANITTFSGKIISAAARVDASVPSFSEGIYRCALLIEARTDGDITVVPHSSNGGMTIRGGSFTRLTTAANGIFTLSGGPGNRFIGVRATNPGGPMFSAAAATDTVISGCDWRGCSALGSVGTSVKGLGTNIGPGAA